MSLAQLQQGRANLLSRKLSNTEPSSANMLQKVTSKVSPISGPTPVDVGPSKISADEWSQKIGGAAKKIINTAVENK